MTNIVKSAATGFAAGAAATVPMSAGFSIAQWLGLIRQLPPRKAVLSVSPRLREPERTQVATISHYLVGGSAGAVYGVVTRVVPAGIGTGILFGLLVWLTGYEVVMPAATGMPKAHRDGRRRAGSILVAHIIFGAALGGIMAAGRKGR